jgi:hypothetical protein
VLKPASLRAALTAAIPELGRDPERMVMVIEAGNILTTGTAALSWEYRYTLAITVLDWAGHADAIIAPLLLWAKHNQPELFDNPERRERALRFKVDFLSTTTVDLRLEIDLTEAVLARQRAGTPGALNHIHKPEPPSPLAILQHDRWEFFIRDEKVAEWDYDPR